MDLPDPRVAIAGDWHGDRQWVEKVFRSLHTAAPDVETLLHVGDFYPALRPLESGSAWLDLIDVLADAAGIRRILVTLGNHEPWPALEPLLAAGKPVQVSVAVWALPRPYRLRIGGREILSLGGAASVNRHRLTEGVEWFPEEAITDAHVAAAIAGGAADLMLTHEGPDKTPVRIVSAQLRKRPWPADALAASQASRERVAAVWDEVWPELLAHGHMHAPGGGRMPDGRRVMSMGANGQWGNVTVLDMATLSGDPVIVTAE